MTRFITHLAIVLAGLALALPAAGQSDTTFTYQGGLNESGGPANGLFDFQFSLWDTASGGTRIGVPQVLDDVPVAAGLFTVQIDFGSNAFDNSNRWLEIAVGGVPLAPRQPITRTPYSIQTRGIFVDNAGSVGIGTTSPGSLLEVTGERERVSIAGSHTATTGTASGVEGQTASSTGRGVAGLATSVSGSAYGGWFESVGSGGRGAYGYASAPSGRTYGVSGQADSPDGFAVYANATANSGTNYGVYARTDSPDGFAGYFSGGRSYFEGRVGIGAESVNAALNVQSSSLYGILSKNTGNYAYFGWNTGPTGVKYGMYGRSDSNQGTGVFGIANASGSNGNTAYGVQGLCATDDGSGVFGWNSSGSGYGVRGGVSGSSNATGVYGIGRTGVWAVSDHATSGYAVFARTTRTSGSFTAVYGQCDSPNGYDFFAGGAGFNYGSTSSRRWKHNVENIDNPLDKLAQLRGVYFDWDAEHGGQHDVGMIAEEVGAVLPEIVNYEANGIDAIGMDYSKMTPLLVEAVNALRSQTDHALAERADEMDRLHREKDSQIAALYLEIDSLQARNDALESRLSQIEVFLAQLLAPSGTER